MNRTILFLAVHLGISAATAWAGVDVRRYGVKGDGVADDSAAIQRALDAAGTSGGTVELGVGRFRLDRAIVVPRGVTLAGVWEAPHHAEIGRGTVIEAYADKGNEPGPPLVELKQSSAVKGITFFYPEQRVPDAAAYPWTIQSQDMHGSVIDCTFVNPYKAMCFGPGSNELHYVRNCFGCPLKAGILVDTCTDIGRIENVHFNPHYWGRANAPNPPKWGDLSRYLWENLVAFEFGRSDWEYVQNTFCYGAKVGYRFVRTGSGTTNGNFLGIGADWCERAILVEQCQEPGLLITNGEFVGGKGSAAMMEVKADNRGPVQLANCSFWGPADAAAILDGAGSVSLSQCLFRNHGERFREVHTIDARGGHLIVQACRFVMDSRDIRLGPGLETAVITGNWFARGQEIDNESAGDVQIGLNVVGDRPRGRPLQSRPGD
ncbi:MAG: hypothetical protein HY718_21505 [Planctomycetes bacterium]|nr:hypothetical protein [Planctomycetota bacterium]